MEIEADRTFQVSKSRQQELIAIVDTLNKNECHFLLELLDSNPYSDGFSRRVTQRFADKHDLVTKDKVTTMITDMQVRLETKIDESNKKHIEYLGLIATETAHNISQPVGIIRAIASGALLNVKENLIDLSSFQNILKRVLAQTDRVSSIINNFRRAARGGQSPPEAVNLTVLLEHTFRIAAPLIQDGVIIQVENAPEQPPIALINPFQLEQVVIGLLVNASEAVQSVENPRIYVGVRWINDHALRIYVADNGVGVAEENVDKIFLPHFSTKSSTTNMGLGLFTSRRILRHYGANILYAPREGGGASFSIILPSMEPTDA